MSSSPSEYLKSPLGIVNLAAVVTNIVAVLACGLTWSSGDVFIQLVYHDHGWQTLVMVFLCGSLFLVCALFVFRSLADPQRVARLTKTGVMFILVVALLLVLLCTTIDVWYVTVDNNREQKGFNRIVAVMVLSIILDLLLLLMILFIGLYYEHFYRIADSTGNHSFHSADHHTQQPPSYIHLGDDKIPSQPRVLLHSSHLDHHSA